MIGLIDVFLDGWIKACSKLECLLVGHHYIPNKKESAQLICICCGKSE